MLTKKAYTLEELFLYLEALEMLDMVYTVYRASDKWYIEYEPSGEERGEPHIEFED